MQRSEIVIIGAGVVGASVAYHLTQRGARDILVLESSTSQGGGSTGKATGGVRMQFETDINILMSMYSVDFLRNWDVECGYEPRGYLFFATDDAQMAYLETNVAKQTSLGVGAVSIVSPQEIAEIVPGINISDITGGSFGKGDGFIDPLAVMFGFTDGALASGARIEFGTTALSIVRAGGRVTAVETNNGRIECEKAVVCTGAVARELAQTAGVDLPVFPQRRQIVWARSAKPLPAGLPMVIDIGTGFHFRPARDRDKAAHLPAGEHDVLFAYPDPDEPASVNTEFDASFVDKVYPRATSRAPFLGDTKVVLEKCRAGLYENTPDHHAILGGCEIEGLYFASGFSGHGVMHSPATGRALAEIMLDGEASFLDVSSLRLERFDKGELLHETAFI